MIVEDIALVMTPGVGVKGVVHLLEIFGGAQQVFAASTEELVVRAELKPNIAQQLIKRTAFAAAEKELQHCARHAITPIASTDPNYPPLLREIPDYPHVLYIQGNPTACVARTLSVVGTRGATPYGQTLCNRLIEGLAERVEDICIVSGLAIGVDAAAHHAALAAGIQTVAVLPCSLPEVVPTLHASLAREIINKGGALVTEIHSQARQNGTAYIARNRIIAGMSGGCVVIESPAKGGSLVTAHIADGYNRTVMALPGRATDKASIGTNYLIQNKKATLITTAEGIIEEMGWHNECSAPSKNKAAPQLSSNEESLLTHFTSSDPLHIEQLAALTHLDIGTLTCLVLSLEMEGLLRRLPGNCYMKL